jgi:hypothetical protein
MKNSKLKVHTQFLKDKNGNCVVILVAINFGSIAWQFIICYRGPHLITALAMLTLK